MANLPEQDQPINSEKGVSLTQFLSIVGGVSVIFLGILAFIVNLLFGRIDAVDSNCKSDIKKMEDKYQRDHDKITKFEDLKSTIQTDHDSLIKLEESLRNLKK